MDWLYCYIGLCFLVGALFAYGSRRIIGRKFFGGEAQWSIVPVIVSLPPLMGAITLLKSLLIVLDERAAFESNFIAGAATGIGLLIGDIVSRMLHPEPKSHYGEPPAQPY